MNPTNYLIQNICKSFVDLEHPPKALRKLVHVNSAKLSAYGDLSFPCSPDVWRTAGNGESVNSELLRALEANDARREQFKSFERQTEDWLFPVERLQVKNQRCLLFLQRPFIIAHFMHTLLNPTQNKEPPFGYMTKNPKKRVYMPAVLQCDEAATKLSVYRSKIVRDTLIRVIRHSDWVLERQPPAKNEPVLQVQVLSIGAVNQTRYTGETKNCVDIKCGLVVEPANNKLASMDTQEYLDLRTNDMCLLARHKYGIRLPNDENFNALMQRMGVAAVSVDFLEVKHSSPVKLILNGHGSTKGGSFLLYNSARVESLLRKFDERVKACTYEGLPDLNDIDMSLLNEEEEWTLVFSYVMGFPQLIESCLEYLEKGQCATHLIVRYLSGFVAVFSMYYRRIRILIHSRDHLLSLVHARIYLVMAIRKVLNMTLDLLNIEPAQFM